MEDDKHDEQQDDDVSADGQQTSNKIVPLRPDKPPESLDSRLEEIRRLLSQSEPISNQYSDAAVIKDEDKFRRRFGPGFRWNRRDRRGLIELKKRYDLTDPEIRLFHYTGNLRRTLLGVQLTASPWIAVWGFVQIGVFGLLFLALLLAAWPRLAAAPLQAVKPILALLALLAFCAGLYWLYVKPWLLRRRKEREYGDE